MFKVSIIMETIIVASSASINCLDIFVKIPKNIIIFKTKFDIDVKHRFATLPQS